MQTRNYLRYIAEEIHTVVFATVDSEGRPVTCAIDMMDYDENGLYFLTARGKNFYDRLKANENVAFTAMKGEDTLSFFGSNISPAIIYPDERSRRALTVFRVQQGTGEWFDLARLPVERFSFSFGGGQTQENGYFVTDKCIGCKLCYSRCPQKCIDISQKPVVIRQEHCLHCGNCFEICPVKAIERRR